MENQTTNNAPVLPLAAQMIPGAPIAAPVPPAPVQAAPEAVPAATPAAEPAPVASNPAPAAASVTPGFAPASAPVAPAQTNVINYGKYKNYTEHDLLVALIKQQKHTSRRTLLVAIPMIIIALVFIVSAVIIVPKVSDLLTTAEVTLDEANSLIEDSADSLDRISNIDVNGFNQAVRDLNNAVTAIKQAFGY